MRTDGATEVKVASGNVAVKLSGTETMRRHQCVNKILGSAAALLKEITTSATSKNSLSVHTGTGDGIVDCGAY